MKLFIRKHKTAFISISACLLIGALTLSFQDMPLTLAQMQDPLVKDTPIPPTDTPKKTITDPGMTMKQFDALPDIVDKSVFIATESLKKIDWAKVTKDMNKAISDVDFEKLSADINRSLSKIDIPGMMAEINKAVQCIEEEKLRTSLSEVARIAQNTIKDVNWDEMRKELHKIKIDLKELNKINLDEIIEGTQKGIEQVRAELKKYKTVFTELEKDGLVNAKKGFKLSWKEGTLYIDDKAQTREISNKYSRYFDRETFTIEIKGEE
jgi:hypothetical protein